jgi:hypothetical protein
VAAAEQSILAVAVFHAVLDLTINTPDPSSATLIKVGIRVLLVGWR